MRKSLLIALAIGGVGAGAYWYYRVSQQPVPPTITTTRVTRGDLAEAVGATGQLQAVTTVQVGTQVSGTIQELNADFNSLVRRGQVLARLDPSLFQTQIEQARANLIRAEADLERFRVSLDDARTKLSRARELSEKRLIAQIELEAAEVAVRSAEAQIRSQQAAVTQSQASLQQNQVNLQHTVIESPIDGLVISRNVDVGQTVAASMSAPTLFVLAADLTKMQVLASLDESDVGRIRPGQAVRFRVDAFPTDEFLGAVTQVRLQPTTIQNVVTYQTVIDVPNPELKLKPGMTANVTIEIARRSNVIRIPNTALRFRPTTEIFTALGQTPPPTGGGRGGRGAGAGQDSRGTVPAGQPPLRAQQPPSVQPPSPERQQVAGERQAPREDRPSSGESAAQKPLASTDDPNGDETGSSSTGRGDGAGRRSGRGNFAERFANMTPEEREQMRERMRARGFTPPSDAEIASAGASRGRGAGAGPSSSAGSAGSAESAAAASRERQPGRTPGSQPAGTQTGGATTFDALFGPLPVTETVGQVWLNVDAKLQRVRLRLGITDGQQTELLEAMDGTVQEGTELVTNVTIGAARQTAAPSGGNAFPGLDTGRRGFGPGVGGGGGGRNAGGGRGQ